MATPVFNPGDPETCSPVTNFALGSLPDISEFFADPPPESDPLDHYAARIQSLTRDIEEYLYEILSDEGNPRPVTIVTLPHHCGGGRERNSVLQPLAWKVSGAGSCYDRSSGRILENCVGAFDGRARTLGVHIRNLVTTPCFLGFHGAVVLAILISAIMGGLSGTEQEPFRGVRVWAAVLIPIIALLFDAAAMAFVIVMDIFFPDEGDPRLAARIQERVEAAIETRLLRLGGESPTVAGAGEKILKTTYPKALEALADRCKTLKKAGGLIEWREMEALLIVLRFVRAVGETAGKASKDPVAVFEDEETVRFLIERTIQSGSDLAHIQLLRLLYKAYCPAEHRTSWVWHDRQDLALNHYMGDAEIAALGKKLASRLKSMPAQRAANVGFALAPVPAAR